MLLPMTTPTLTSMLPRLVMETEMLLGPIQLLFLMAVLSMLITRLTDTKDTLLMLPMMVPLYIPMLLLLLTMLLLLSMRLQFTMVKQDILVIFLLVIYLFIMY